jgi:hypothetical protein
VTGSCTGATSTPGSLERTLEEQARTGRAHRVGAMLVERGIVDHAAVRDVVQEQVVDAVFELLDWRYGAYRFDPGAFGSADEVPEVPLRLRVDQLLAEVARRQREWGDLEQVLPDLEAVPRFPASGGTSTSTTFEADELALLASIDGVRSVRALADDLGFGRFEAARIVYGLNRRDVLEIVLPEDEIGRALEEAIRGLSPDGREAGGREGDGPPPPPDPPSGTPLGPLPAAAGAGADADADAGTGTDADVAPAEPAAATEPDDRTVAAESEEAHEPPAISDVSRLLAELETDIGGPRSSPDEAAPDPEAEPDPAVAADPAGSASDRPPVPEPEPEPEPRPSGEDISELLRELSRMAHEGPDAADGTEPPLDGGTPGSSSPGAPGVSGPDATPRRKRRFGRG